MKGLLPDLRRSARTSRSWSAPAPVARPAAGLPGQANTSQKPQSVIDTMVDHLELHNANIARARTTSVRRPPRRSRARATLSRASSARPSATSVIFTKNASEALNLVANTCPGAPLAAGDEVVTTEMEHHSNIVPWQLATQRAGATLKLVRDHRRRSSSTCRTSTN